MAGFVYFISDNAASIKIGYSTDVERRLRGLAVGNAQALRLIGYVEGDRSQERQLHAALSDYRSSGEWFADCPTVRAMVGRVLDLGLVAAGFDVKSIAPSELESLAEARRLAEVVLRCSGSSLRDGPGDVCGVPHSLLWRLRYRPNKDVWADELTLLREGALKATEVAIRRAYEDREFAVEMSERASAVLVRFDHGQAEIAAAEQRLENARAVLRQAADAADVVVVEDRQRLKARNA